MSNRQSLNINIGNPMQIEFESVRYRLKSEFIGMLLNSFLIVKMPPSKSLPNASKIFSQGTKTVVRFVNQGTAYGFSTTVNRALYKPSKLLFLNYPKSVETYQLRNYERVLCLLPASLKFSSENVINGHVVDISKEGCQFSADNSVFYNKQELPAKDNPLTVSLQLPGFQNTITIACKVKNINAEKEQVKMGLKLVSMSDDAHERLYDFLESVGVV
ncbi:MAG: flagellar brake protein [Candidatus Magnetomorum sp.]|nr:flagellar brake protein [Candidatus Magnetomorum sp.]